jgi:hypothetical protein
MPAPWLMSSSESSLTLSSKPLQAPAALSLADVEGVLGRQGEARQWLVSARSQNLKGRVALARAYASSGRALRKDAVSLVELGRPHWSWLDWGRLWLVLSAFELEPASEHSKLIRTLVEHGELGEQASALRVLAYLPGPARFTAVGVEACRTNATSVFEALALDNPFAALYFAIKAAFMAVPIARIFGLEARLTPELARMAESLASERRAAGRSVPDDLSLLIKPGDPK